MQNCLLTGEKSPEFCVINWELVPKCSWGSVQGSGQSPELLVLVCPFLLVLEKCCWDLVQESGLTPGLLVLVFHFLVVLWKWSLKWAWSLVQVQGRAQSSWFLFSPSCLSLGKGGSCHALFSKPSARQESAGISGAGAELCCGVPAIRLWLFTVSGIEKYLEFSSLWGQVWVTLGSAESSFSSLEFSSHQLFPPVQPVMILIIEPISAT